MRYTTSTRAWIVPLLIVLSCPAKRQVAGEPAAPTVDSVCLSEILISTPQPYDSAQIAAAQRKADGAREAIRRGQKFEDIATKYSDGPSAGLGGALGLFKRGQLAKSLEDKVFAMKIGDVSDVIRTKQGFTILKVVECGPARSWRSTGRPFRPRYGSRKASRQHRYLERYAGCRFWALHRAH